MSKKKKSSASQTTDTPKTEVKKAKKAPLSNTAIRFVGFLIAFLGIMFITTKESIISTLLNVLSVFLILWGLYLVSGSVKKLGSESTDKNKAYLNLLLGLLMIVAGILIILYGTKLSPYFNIIVGCGIGIYGIMMLVKFICSARTKKTTFGIIMSVLTIITGILVCLLYIPEIRSASNGVCYIVFGSFATAVGCLEIVCY